MKNEMKSNPSGKVVGLNFIAIILFFAIFLGVNGLIHFDTIKESLIEIKEAFEEAYEDEFYEYEEETYLNELHEYLIENDIYYEELEELYFNDEYGKLTLEDYNYTFEYNYSYLDFKLENSTTLAQSFYISGGDYAILNIDNGIILVEYNTNGNFNTYRFLDTRLNNRLKLTASNSYEPILGDDGYIYFAGSNDLDELAIYQYDTLTHTFIEVY